jgi:hypothetical protein
MVVCCFCYVRGQVDGQSFFQAGWIEQAGLILQQGRQDEQYNDPYGNKQDFYQEFHSASICHFIVIIASCRSRMYFNYQYLLARLFGYISYNLKSYMGKFLCSKQVSDTAL